MAKMRAAQVRAGKGPFEIVERDVPEPGPGLGSGQGAGLRDLSQRFPDEGGDLARHTVPARAGARGGRDRRRHRRRRRGPRGGGASRPGMARRALRILRLLPPRGLPHLPVVGPDPGHHVRRRSRGLRGRPGGRAGADPRRSFVDRRCAAHVRRDHHLQLACATPARRSGDLVAVLGIGGLGHLGVQFAARMGYETVAIARGKDKEPLARKLGAHHYIDSEAQDPAKALSALGGAKVVLATVTSGKAMTAVLGGLADRRDVRRSRAPPTSRSRSRPSCSSRVDAGSWAGPRAPRPTRRTRWRSARATACGR